MGGNKWKIEQNGQFLGHHSGHTPKDAVDKACRTYGQIYPVNPNEDFICTKGKNVCVVKGTSYEG